MLSFWDWDKEVTSWHEKRNAEPRKGEITLPNNHRHHTRDTDKDCVDMRACDRNVRKSYEVSLPVTVTPYAIASEPDACCGGDARVRQGHKCDNKSKCHKFTISQIINVDIPIEFGAQICYEDFCSEERGRCTDDQND